MFDYLTLKNKAVSLRKQGKTYSEILKEIKVAKSTLSLWLRCVGLSKKMQYRISEKKLLSARRGGQVKKQMADKNRASIYSISQKEIGKVSKRELWLVGASLYWAEGSKEKPNHSGFGVKFTNSDPSMVRLFLIWLKIVCKIKDSDIKINLTIHETSKTRVVECLDFWAKSIDVSKNRFGKVYFKRNNVKTCRQNTRNQYYGIVSITVLKSSGLLRRITGWTQGIGNYSNMV